MSFDTMVQHFQNKPIEHFLKFSNDLLEMDQNEFTNYLTDFIYLEIHDNFNVTMESDLSLLKSNPQIQKLTETLYQKFQNYLQNFQYSKYILNKLWIEFEPHEIFEYPDLQLCPNEIEQEIIEHLLSEIKHKFNLPPILNSDLMEIVNSLKFQTKNWIQAYN